MEGETENGYRATYSLALFLVGNLCETSSRWRVLDPVSPTVETDAAEGKSREGSLCRFRLCQNKNQHKAPSLAGASANASLPSVSPVGETGFEPARTSPEFRKALVVGKGN